jgi:hypothetical protein
MKTIGQRTVPASAERVQRHRAALRAKGLKSKTVWVPDTSDTAFVKEYRRQIAVIARNPGTRRTVEELEETTETRGWV